METHNKHINLGILAHVDAGKTTLTEALLYTAGNLRQLGRVDNRNSFLDTDVQERERGITIFSKQAKLAYEDMQITLLDTPGHVDFSAEAESVLQVLDYCILIVSAPDGIKGHTLTIWSLLKEYGIPTFLFVNKMDQPGMEREKVLQQIRERLDAACIDFSDAPDGFTEEDKEAIAVCDEKLMEAYLESGHTPSAGEIAGLVAERKCFPVLFGSALKLEGIRELMQMLSLYTGEPAYGEDFAARVFKITRDAQGNRLTHLKVMGGILHSKDLLDGEKINQIRVYSGEKFESVTELEAGRIGTVTGLGASMPGQGYGALSGSISTILEPVLSYRVKADDGTDDAILLKDLRILEEEDPQLFVTYEEEHREILLRVMGEVQLEVLQRSVKDRFGIDISYGDGAVVYKETIAAPVEGVGHFEPLRHYAEVHLLLEPQPRGSGLSFASVCSEDILDKNWQRLIMTHLQEKKHRGVLTGAAITDMKITILTGRAHQKHTEGGDFRQATYRAVRQGLMQAESILLEPYYQFRMELPAESLGRAMTDVENMQGRMEAPQIEGERAILCGQAPVVCIRNYSKEIAAYTKGAGSISLRLCGYEVCHNAEEVIAAKNYLPEADLRNTPDSVFCAHGSGFVVPWDQVYDYMHVESDWHGFSDENVRKEEQAQSFRAKKRSEAFSMQEPGSIGTDEIDAILNQTFYSNSNSNIQAETQRRKGVGEEERRRGRAQAAETEDAYADYAYRPVEKKKEILLVDGYNMIFAWDSLKGLAKENLDSARDSLIDIMSNYQGTKAEEVIVVFDAYRVKGRRSEQQQIGNLQVVYTGEGETADQYIERFTSKYGKACDVSVATSDRLEQAIAWGNNCRRISARELELLIAQEQENVRKRLKQD